MEYSVGLNLRLMRERAHFTQQELAEKMGYSSSSSIAKIETGMCGLQPYKAMKFAKVLGCELSDLIPVEELPIVKESKEAYEKRLQQNAEDLLKFEALRNILGMLANMNADQIIKIEKVIRTLSED